MESVSNAIDPGAPEVGVRFEALLILAASMATYDTIGRTYARFRQPDRRISAALERALGDAESVVNVGAGTGSYESTDRQMIAVEPSETMIAQRPPNAAPCLTGLAEALPLPTASADAAMAVLSIHHWRDPELGLREMRRVARKRVVLLTWVPDAEPFWLTRDYFPEIAETDRAIFPATEALLALFERNAGPARIAPLPIPHDCTDGFLAAYWRRPEAYLDNQRRQCISSFAWFDPAKGLALLREDLATGRWAERNAELLSLEALDAGYRIVTCEIAG